MLIKKYHFNIKKEYNNLINKTIVEFNIKISLNDSLGTFKFFTSLTEFIKYICSKSVRIGRFRSTVRFWKIYNGDPCLDDECISDVYIKCKDYIS